MKYIIEDKDLISIADSIRAKNGSQEKLTVKEMPNSITSLTTEPDTVIGTINFYRPYRECFFYYEDKNGEINKVSTTSSGDNTHNYEIRKNSLIIFYGPYFIENKDATIAVGLDPSILEAANGNGIEIIENKTITYSNSTKENIIIAICKAIGNFTLDWSGDLFSR